jgi:DNA primase
MPATTSNSQPNTSTTLGNHASRLSRTPEGLIYSGDVLTYRITGLQSYNLDRMKVTLKANPTGNADLCHIDNLDLYNSRSREAFAESCAKYLKAQQAAVMLEQTQLIKELEAERIAMHENGSSAAAVPEMTTQEKEEALALRKSKDLIKQIVFDFNALGFVGEESNKLLGYLAGISRMQPDPIALLILSRPGAGKTSLQEIVCKFMAPESVIQYTRLTGQALFYQEQNALKHKILAIEEEEGLQQAMYSVKTLISSQKLTVATTRTDPKTGKLSVDEYTVNGPVVVMVSTTNPDALDDETKQRFMVLTIDETAEQTRNILLAQRTKNSHRWYEMSCDESSITKLHHTMQRLLKPLTATFPDTVKINWPFSRLQMRREHKKFFSLVKAIALLHQYQRKTGTMKRKDGSKIDYVQVTQADIDLALKLGRDVFVRDLDDVSPTGRTLLAHVYPLVIEKHDALKAGNPDMVLCEVPFTRKELREETGWSETQIRRTLDHLVELGYIGRIVGRHGATFRYVLLDDGKNDPLMSFDDTSTT